MKREAHFPIRSADSRKLRLFVLAASGLVLAFAPLIARSQQAAVRPSGKAKTAAKDSAKDPAREITMPFRAGETLTYNVAWSAFSSAATVQLSVPERKD